MRYARRMSEEVVSLPADAPDPIKVAEAFAEFAGLTDGGAVAEGDWAGYTFSGNPVLRSAKAKACKNRAITGKKNAASRGIGISLYRMLQCLGEKPGDPKGVYVEDPEFIEAFERAYSIYIEDREERLDKRAFDGWETTKRAGKDAQGHFKYEKVRVYDKPEIAKMRMAAMDPARYGDKPAVSINNNNSRTNVLNLPEGFSKSLLGNFFGEETYAKAIETVDVKALPEPEHA